ncbi:lipase family protein [Nocardia sp. CDC160]|uniref:lipase family protein n=1 Tax=Nocardia sp. CDC160 TaxID=3112166 RepID=UPI002DBF3609|nr:lipase family protein [Nocardia sp. CDC160]MEC3914972.1 lipase family protein [Nocardia sp. CDC160]
MPDIRRIGVFLGGTALLIALGVSVSPARPEPVAPDDDPFYSAPSDIAEHAPGSLLNHREISIFGLPIRVSTWHLQYRTTGPEGRPVAAVATVMVSASPWPGPGARPLLSYQVAEDSLGTRCAPSFALHGGRDSAVSSTAIETPFIVDALRRGWAVVVPDYQGPESRFLDGANSGRAVLDGIRAARTFAPAGLSAASPIGAWGYSGGAFATLWAAQLRRTYAPELPIAGVTAGGIPTDLATMARNADGGAQAGLSMLIVLALIRNAPGSELAGLLNDRGRAALSEAAGSCGLDLLTRYSDVHLDEYSKTPELLSQSAFAAAARQQELGDDTPDMPLYLYHSTTDETIPIAGFDTLTQRYCGPKSTVIAHRSGAAGHKTTALVEAPGGMAFLADRFAGEPLAPGCSVS